MQNLHSLGLQLLDLCFVAVQKKIRKFAPSYHTLSITKCASVEVNNKTLRKFSLVFIIYYIFIKIMYI